jgi:hypothetical protein
VLLARWRVPLGRGAAPVFAMTLFGLWIAGFFYAEVTVASALLLAAAPVVAGLAGLPALRRVAPWQATLARTAAVLVPVGLALVLALAAQPEAGPYAY